MALVRLEPSTSFDGEALYQALARELPTVALPLFLRIGDGRALLTETYKIGVAELKRQGYATEEAEDPVYLLDARAGRYVPVTDASLREARLPPFQRETAAPTP